LERGTIQGSVLKRREILEDVALLNGISSPRLRREYRALYEYLGKHSAGKRWIVALRSPSSSEDWTGMRYLLHEFVHALLNENGLRFEVGGNGWELDEGLCTYMMAFLGEEDLDAKVKRNSLGVYETYLKEARKWRKILAGCRTPAQRREKLFKRLTTFHNHLRTRFPDSETAGSSKSPVPNHVALQKYLPHATQT